MENSHDGSVIAKSGDIRLMKKFIIGFILGALCFGSCLYARDVITAFDNRGLAVLNDELRNVYRILRNFGRGDTDEDITYVRLYNASGTECYLYPDSGGTGITVSTTKP